MTDVLVYAASSRARVARTLLRAACQVLGTGVRLEVYGTGALYQRLGPRRAPPFPDVVLWFGPYAARSAALDGLLQPYQPAHVADGVPHDPDWNWTTLDFSAIGVLGPSAPRSVGDLAAVPQLAIPDPERSEAGLAMLLATLVGDVDAGWQWWTARAQRGMVLTEDDAAAISAVNNGFATHALTLQESGAPVSGLAPLPHAVGLGANSRNVDAGRRLVDWLAGPHAAALVRYSGWTPAANGLQNLLAVSGPVDVEWARQQYAAVRRRWALSGFGPTPAQ
jgi:ABC-type Fe3+ transport system substrate-binding protein